MNETEWWVSTKDFLPNIGERVLIISKFGNISDATLANYGFDRPALFSPDGYVPGVDVKWWMTIPTDGWSDITEVKPKEGEAALTMGRYGSIYSGVWKRFFSDFRARVFTPRLGSPFLAAVAGAPGRRQIELAMKEGDGDDHRRCYRKV